MLELRLRYGVDELLDAGEDVELLLDREGDGDLSPAFRDLLFTLDESITDAYRNSAVGSAPGATGEAARAR